MNKSDFSKKVKEALNLNSMRCAADTVDKLANLILELTASGEEITLGKLGKFVVVERAERKAHNPRTGETFTVPAKKVVKFKESGTLKHTEVK